MKVPTAALSQISTSHSSIVTKSGPMFAVTLFRMRDAPLFRLTARAGSELPAIADAERAYASILPVIGASPGLGGDLACDPALTQVQRGAREAESWKLQYLVRFAGEISESETRRHLSGSHARALLEEVIGADPGLLAALTNGATIEPCPFQDWARNTGWITVDCAFRATDGTGVCRDMRPLSSAMRDAVRFIALDVLSRGGETVRIELQHRQALGRHVVQSATLRAARKSQGPRTPTNLIAWLISRDLHDVAEAVRTSLDYPQR